MLLEYQTLREEILRSSPQLAEDNLNTLSTLAFQDKFGISYDKAKSLESDAQWTRWLAKHPTRTEYIFSDQLKATEDKHGRFVSFDLITSDIDQSSDSSGSPIYSQKFDDLIPPETIAIVGKKLRGAVINMYDPSKVKDYSELVWEGARKGGVGHEHMLVSPDIVPALIIDEVKAIDNNTKLRVIAKINEFSQRANDVWGMITGGILNGASIEYNVLKETYKDIGGRIVRVINDMDLSGFTLTGKSRNANCMTNGWFVKALETSRSPAEVKQEVKMVEEAKKDEQVKAQVVTPPVESKPSETETQLKALIEDMKVLRDDNAKLTTKVDELKALESDKKMIDQFKDVIKEEVKAALQTQDKVLVEPDQTKFEVAPYKEELKAAVAKGDLAAIGRIHNELAQKGLI